MGNLPRDNLLALVIQKVDNKILPINLQPCGYILQFFHQYL